MNAHAKYLIIGSARIMPHVINMGHEIHCLTKLVKRLKPRQPTHLVALKHPTESCIICIRAYTDIYGFGCICRVIVECMSVPVFGPSRFYVKREPTATRGSAAELLPHHATQPASCGHAKLVDPPRLSCGNHVA